MSRSLTIYRTAERPDLHMWLEDDDGDLVDFSSGYTFAFKLGRPGQSAIFTKTSGITGAAGAGVEPTGTPNVTVSFTAGELDSVSITTCVGQLRATSSSLDRVFQFDVKVKDVIT